MSVFEIQKGVFNPIGQNKPEVGSPLQKGSEFKEILNKELSFSQHARTRIQSRELPWNHALEKRIVGGMEHLEKKGSREALILADSVAVIANIQSRTIITAMDSSRMKEKVFTNIDSVVLV